MGLWHIQHISGHVMFQFINKEYSNCLPAARLMHVLILYEVAKLILCLCHLTMLSVCPIGTFIRPSICPFVCPFVRSDIVTTISHEWLEQS